MSRHLTNPTKWPAPYEFHIARVCEAYKVMPTRAMWEIEHDPDGMVFTVMQIWNFEHVKAQIERAKEESDMPTGAMADLVLDIKATLARETVAARIKATLAELDHEEEDEAHQQPA